MEPMFDSQSLTTSSSTPHTPSPRLDGQPDMQFEYNFAQDEQNIPQNQNQSQQSYWSGSDHHAPTQQQKTVYLNDYDEEQPHRNDEAGLYSGPSVSSSSGYLRSDWPPSSVPGQQQPPSTRERSSQSPGSARISPSNPGNMSRNSPPMHLNAIDDSHTAAHSLYRRASFPFVHHDHNSNISAGYPKYMYTPDHHDGSSVDGHYEPESIKLEQAPPAVVPSQQNHHPHSHPYYRPSSSPSAMSNGSAPPSSYLGPMNAMPIMHTDDAASKETQYLRRKCFNCQTTEPPSWRRSTLNPGKIVCNKCGLYERTHNKPRPHQFGLRPGNKTRKPPAKLQTHGHSPPSPSTKARHSISVKKEPLDYSHHPMRRGSIASINSGSGTSDWDDHSGYSTASSVYPSPMGVHAGSYSSMPPPRTGGSGSIRLPQAPLMKMPSKHSPPPNSLSAPATPYGSALPHYGGAAMRSPPVPPSADYYARRGSLGIPPSHHAHTAHEMGSVSVNMMRRQSLSIIGGMSHPPSSWQPPPPPVPLSEMSVTPAPAVSNSADSTPRRYMDQQTPPPTSPVSAGINSSAAGAPALAPEAPALTA